MTSKSMHAPTNSELHLPEFCLVVLASASTCSIAEFAARHFAPQERIALTIDCTSGSIDLVQVGGQLAARQLTVVETTNLTHNQRLSLAQCAKRHHARLILIILSPGKDVCLAPAPANSPRDHVKHLTPGQYQALEDLAKHLPADGIDWFEVLRSEAQITTARVIRDRLPTDRRTDSGPFDIIGDVHGCASELEQLLSKLGYGVHWNRAGPETSVHVTPPVGRRAIFVGDLVDRGPRTPDVLRIVMSMVRAGSALCVPGNHDVKCVRWLKGEIQNLKHGLAETAAQMEGEPTKFHHQVREFFTSLASHLWLDDGRLAVAHAGVKAAMIGRDTGRVRGFCLYGETSGETDTFGLPIRYNWAAEYQGDTMIVYGHTPVPDTVWLNNTICIDTGCCFGGRLTALRYPEKQLVQVAAERVYAAPVRPFAHPPPRPQSQRRDA